MEEEITLQATCGFCGRQFEPHADSYWETGISAEIATDEELDNGIEATPENLGVDPSDLHKLNDMAAGEVLETGAMAVCDECSAKPPNELV